MTGTTSDTRANALAGRISAAMAAISARAAAIEAAEPLQPGVALGPGEDEWGPREVLAHVAEAVPYWHGQLERVLTADPDAGPAPFGRIQTDMARIAVTDRDRILPVFVLLDRVNRDAAAVTARIRRLTPAELDRIGRHSAWGDITLEDVLERTLAGHLEGHVTQLDELFGRSRPG